MRKNNTNAKDERYKERNIVIATLAFSKFAMTEGENKRRNKKDGFPPARE